MGDRIAAPGGLSVSELDLMRSVEDDHWWYRALRDQVVASLRPSPLEFTLLDAGCGSGGLLARVRERFPHASLTGLDLNEHALQLTEERQTNARLVQGSVDQIPLAEAAFDVVVSLDVLYHRDVDERAALREMRRVLRSGGRLIVNVPAFNFLRGSHDVAVNTARRYTRPRLRKLLDEAGLNIEKITYWNMMLLPAVTVVRWASRERAKRSEVRSDLAPPGEFLNSILGVLTHAEFALSRRFPLPFGTSVFAIARK